ncbi:MAG: hypothetical protein HYX35_03700 [Proteobacteria bacterium]|nr:hypothetical protein [Pseudomonadota bacterium]
MGLITQNTVSFVRKIFILAIIQSLFLSFGLYAMEEEELPSFYSPCSSRALLLEEGEGESTSVSLPEEQMPIEEDATPFFHLHLGVYAKIVGYLESADQCQLAFVCKNTLAKATLFAFRRFFISLPEDWRRDIFQGKSEEEAYKQFQELSDEGALEQLYVQTLLLQFQSKGNYGAFRRYFISLPEDWRRDIFQDKSEEEAYKQLQELSDKGASEQLYVQAILLQFQDKGNYGLLRLALLKNEHFKKVEETAKQRAMQDFCLNDQDQEDRSWMKTLVFYSLFFEEYNNLRIRKWLTQQKFSLAQLLSGLAQEEDSSEHEGTTRSILKSVCSLQNRLAEDTSFIMSLDGRLTVLTNIFLSLFKENKLRGTLAKLAKLPASAQLTWRETFAKGKRISREELLTMLSEQELARNRPDSVVYEKVVSFLSSGLFDSKVREKIYEGVEEAKKAKQPKVARNFEFMLIQECLMQGLVKFYFPWVAASTGIL